MSKTSRYLWGLVLIALGVILGINALGIVQINIFFPGWWTLFIIVPCVIGLLGNDSDKWADLTGIIVGVALLLACQGWLSFKMVWSLIVPVILIVVGLSMLMKDVLRGKVTKEIKKLHKEGSGKGKEYWATFSGQNVNFAGQVFEGCRLEAVFGGVKCDLREAKIKEDVLIRASAVFGGVTILMPEDVNVQVVSSAMFGGVTNKYAKEVVDEKKKTIFVESTALFGGVEIK